MIDEIEGCPPSFSIIMPAYNAEATIAEAIGSVRGESLSDRELLVVNDGSTDNTADVVRRFLEQDSRIKLFSLTTNSGKPAAPAIKACP